MAKKLWIFYVTISSSDSSESSSSSSLSDGAGGAATLAFFPFGSSLGPPYNLFNVNHEYFPIQLESGTS